MSDEYNRKDKDLEATETVATVEESEPETGYAWRVLKRDENADGVFIGAVWVELAPLFSDYSYYPPQAKEIGEAYGAGEYLLIRGAETSSVASVHVVGVTRYEEYDPTEEQS